MQTCKKCVLNERFVGIRFDQDGICNFCSSAKSADSQRSIRGKYEAKFRKLIEERKGTGSYDALVAYSGGKDSTYTLHLLRERYDLRLLAYSFDNWYQSERAKRNIRAVLSNVNVDHMTITPGFERMKKIVLESMSDDMYSAKAMARASSICTSCISLVRFVGFRLAIEQQIPFLVFGMSPGQAPMATAVVKTNPQMVRTMQETLLRPLFDRLGDVVKPFFLEERHFDSVEDFPYSVNPLAFADYDEQVIYETADKYGWKKPDDTDANSTNCLLNALANQVHLDQFGVNPYAYEIGELVRTGCMTREEGLARLAEPFPAEQIVEVKRSLGIE
ncbi:MAG: adenine nucleotide alpha hydrolase family protein [Planctomycetota bacterium]